MKPARIFLDLKLHDIPNTVAGAVRSASALDVDMLTVHLSGGGTMLRAANRGGQATCCLLGVTVLTSSDEATLHETGVTGTVEEQVMRLAQLGTACGLRGVVASPREIRPLRATFRGRIDAGNPGRAAGRRSGRDDQQRVMTPGEAIAAGADYLVIGRPITAQADPAAAARRIAEEIAGASLATAKDEPRMVRCRSSGWS